MERASGQANANAYQGLQGSNVTKVTTYNNNIFEKNNNKQVLHNFFYQHICINAYQYSHFIHTIFSCSLTLRKKCPYSEYVWSIFSRLRTENGEIRSISPYSVWMRENADQNNSEYVHFSSSLSLTLFLGRDYTEIKWMLIP